MNQLEIKTYPDPCLRVRTRPVEDFNKDLEETVRKMADLMYISNGIGLAATQVGLGLCLFIADIGEGLRVFANPEIVETSKAKDRMEEGCLSLPGISVNVSRPLQIKVRAQDAHGDVFLEKFSGLMAKVIQHEMDHLNGKMLIDHLNSILRIMAERKLTRWKNDSKM